MAYTSDRSHELITSVKFTEARNRWASLDPNVVYLQDVIKHEFGSDIASNTTSAVEQHPTAGQQPGANIVTNSAGGNKLADAYIAIEAARQNEIIPEGDNYGN